LMVAIRPSRLRSSLWQIKLAFRVSKLVLRFRCSHHIAAPTVANLGIKGALENL
jgi:IS4 transposase